MTSRTPLIGLTCDDFKDAQGSPLLGLRPPYCQAVVEAGGVPVLVPCVEDAAQAAAVLDSLDGFVLTGGDDLTAERLGEPLHPAARPMSARRDRPDFLLIESLVERRLPTLAICLGFQELNVFFGGSLHQDLPSLDAQGKPVVHRGQSPEDRYARHEVRIAPGGLLARLWGGEWETSVNSAHHQGVARLGRGLEAQAWAPDGLVEAFQAQGFPFLLGVQWHPERLMAETPHAALFRALTLEAIARPEAPARP
jgi:putative glutamine amidotransferase